MRLARYKRTNMGELAAEHNTAAEGSSTNG